MLGEKFLQVRLDTVFDQTGVDTELVARIVVDLFESDAQLLARLVGDDPQASASSTDSSSSQQGGLIQFRGL